MNGTCACARPPVVSLGKLVRLLPGAMIAAAMIVSPAVARSARPEAAIAFSIDRPTLEEALLQFASQAQVLISMRPEDVRQHRARRITGKLPPSSALASLLAGSGLVARWISSANVVIVVADAGSHTPAPVSGKNRSAIQSPPTMPMIAGEDIIVAARRRDERLQDVPMSITTFSGDWLKQQRIGNLAQVADLIPALKIAPAPVAEQIYMRGAGSSLNSGFEQSVGTFVDGAYRGRSRSVRTALFDVERVELLKGPQTTFFGNSTVAGAINVTTRKPGKLAGYDFTANATPATSESSLEGGVNVPVSDRLSLRLAGKASRSGGYVVNTGTGHNGPGENDRFGRLSLRWTPVASARVDARIDIGRMDDTGIMNTELERCPPDPAIFELVGPCARYIAAVGAANVDDRHDYRSADGPNFFKYDFIEGAQTTTIDVGGGDIILGSSFFRHRYDILTDTAPIPARYESAVGSIAGSPARFIERFNQATQEIRFQSEANNSIKYSLGLYLVTANLNVSSFLGYYFKNFDVLGKPSSLPIASSFTNTEHSASYSAFAAASIPLSSRLTIDIGGRYTIANKHAARTAAAGSSQGIIGPQTFVALPVEAASTLAPQLGIDLGDYTNPSRRDRSLQPSAAIRYQLAPSRMIYASYARGFKGGGYSVFTNKSQFDAEHVDAFEFGFKATTPDRRGIFTIAAFESRYYNLQGAATLVLPDGGILNRVGNVGASVSRGVDIFAAFDVVPGLTLTADLAYLHSRYHEYRNAPCTIVQLAAASQVCAQDLTGRVTAWAPTFSGTTSLTFERPVSARLNLNIGASAHFSSEYYVTPAIDPYLLQSGFVKFDTRIALGSTDERWQVALVGRNLTNCYTANYRSTYAGSLGVTQVLPDAPRLISLQLSIKR